MQYNVNPMPEKKTSSNLLSLKFENIFFFGATADKVCQAKTVLSEANTVTVESVKRNDVKKRYKIFPGD
jgi:hypothetical protein